MERLFLKKNISEVISRDNEICNNSKFSKTAPFGWWWEDIRHQRKGAESKGQNYFLKFILGEIDVVNSSPAAAPL